VHDFVIPELGRAVPYGVYDIAGNAGWVSVGINHDTAAFAANAIRSWWNRMGRERYPNARLPFWPSVWRSPQAIDWARPCPAAPTEPPGNPPSKCPASRAPAAASPGSSSVVPKGEESRRRTESARPRWPPRDPQSLRATLDRADSGLNGAFRTMTVAHNTIAAVRKLEVLHRLEKGLRLQLDCLRQ
jgi:hypothetical protein